MSLTAVLFAGGESRRMGVDKATLDRNGEPLWARQIRVLRALQPDEIWISARAKPAWCPAEIEVALDETPSRGPFSGLVAALKRLQTSHLLSLAIDMPRMTSEHLKKLHARIRPSEGIIPRTERGFEPLCAIYPAGAMEVAKEILIAGESSLQVLAQKLVEQRLVEIYEIAKAELRLYWNANTPDDYHEAALG